ncbi:hypothetical protein LSH36_143g03036 [Paralvinella palmiformis]|uniref:Integrin beta n=1 Tax=Paralvinella palmiformis TaxID=53620 RepID=A0AAD9JXD7_9ANNE|nr:hypothetical protein LSH36_143g03036 [Paralvinella palmiformis]
MVSKVGKSTMKKETINLREGFICGEAEEGGNVCTEQESCGACVAAHQKCGWCMQTRYDDTNRGRCDYVQNLIAYGCDDEYLVTPKHKENIIRNDPPRNSDDYRDAIQLTPQEIEVNLRPNMPYTLNLTFRQAENYPVDLYYVMDLSYSMLDDKDKLAVLGKEIAVEMNKITENFRLGFGSYVDKKTMPYVSVVPSKLQEPCTGCAPPYGFKNQLPLTEDADQFTERVRQAPISGNLDSPEGTFDAMMQAIACKADIGWRLRSRKLLLVSTDNDFHFAGDGKGDIGWREASRKMLLVSTDNDFHYAGDGKLGGIVTPNDGHCHLDSNHEDSESLFQDYPSVSQLAYRISEEKVNVIFAITKEQLPKFNRLSNMIEGAMVGELANDSSNIVQLIKDNYKKISGKVELRTDASDGVDIQFKTKCQGDEELDVSYCDKLGVGDSVTFQVTIEVTECPENEAELDKLVTIYPVGLAEKLSLRLKLICSCPCEKPDFKPIGDVLPPQPNSPMCNGSGTYQCGACACNEKHYGKNCQCDGSTVDSDDYDATCKRTNTSEICEGNGRCECGRCICKPLYIADPSKTFSGKYCECNDYACDFFDGEICGGPSRGVCKCGKCHCKLGYTGKSCNCPTSKESCMAKNGLICNGKGECICGRCQCTLDQYYKGRTCEDCPSCPGHCDANKACVQCEAFGTGPYTREYCEANCTHVRVVPEVEKEDMPDRRLCMSRDEDDCDFYFTYFYDNDQVLAQEKKECPEPVNVLAIVLGVIGGIIAIGLALLLIWKLLVTIHDRREFAKFEKDRQNAKWDMGENPIFKPSTSTFQNPTYGNK